MRTKKVIYLIFLTIVLLILLPLLIDWLIIGNRFPSNISNSDWISFLGGYIGAIIGAVVSLIGIAVTIRFTNDQNKKDRELQIRPYCSIRCVQNGEIEDGVKILSHLSVACDSESNQGSRSLAVLYIKNIGLGAAIDFEFDVADIDDGRKHYRVPIIEDSKKRTNILQPGEEGAFPIYYWFNFEPVSPDELVDLKLLGKTFKIPIGNNHKEFEINITIKYSDLLQNSFIQKVTLRSVFGVSYGLDGTINRSGDFELKEISKPQKINIFSK